MLGKIRLRPSFLLEVAFLVGVWLVAWRVFNPPLAVLVFVIFAAYALVFLYENWLDNLSRRERAEARRSLRNENELYRPVSEPRLKPWSPHGVTKPVEAEPAAAHSISERMSAKLHDHEPEEKESRAAVPNAVSLENPVARIETSDPPEPEPQPESPRREEPPPSLTAKNAPASASEAVSAPRREPVSAERRIVETGEQHSLLADIAAGPDARKATGSVGGWNIWQLERLLAAQVKPDPERDYERSMLLVYLREFAGSDGQLPSKFDDLVRESFGDIVRGPAS